MNPFDKYLQSKGSTTTQPVSNNATTSSPFDVAIANKASGNEESAFDKYLKTKANANPKITKQPLRWAGKQLMKPSNLLANIGEPIGKAITELAYGNNDAALSEIKKMPRQVWEGLSGKSDRGFLELGQEAFPENKTAGTLLGLGISLVADPLNVVGGGLTNTGKLLVQLNKFKKAGIVVEKASKIPAVAKLAKQLTEAGIDIKKASLGATKVEQALKGERAFLKAGNIPLLPRKTSAAIYKATGKVGEAVGKIPVIEKGRQLFNTSTGNKAADAVIRKAKDTRNFLEQNAKETAIAMMKELKAAKIPKEDFSKVVDYIEKGIDPGNETLKRIADVYKTATISMVQAEQKVGLDVPKIENYFARYLSKEGKKMADKGFLGAKEFSTSLGNAEKRDILKFKSENGHEIIGTVKSAGLSPVDNVKALSHDLTWGEFKSLKEVEDRLSRTGIKIEYKPQAWLNTHGGPALGYFDPHHRKIVIASGRPLKSVINTIKHELTHNAHFQLAGNIEMLETMAKGGRSLRLKVALNEAKAAVIKEKDRILEFVNGITPEEFKKLSKLEQEYYTKPTELIARVGESYLKDPARARLVFPESVKAFDKLRAESGLFDILNTEVIPRGEKLIGQVYRDKNGELYQAIVSGPERVTTSEIHKSLGKKLFNENPAVSLAYRGIANAKAVSSARLFNDIRKFASDAIDAVEVKVPELAGLKFDPGIATQLDRYYKAMNPEEIKSIIKGFDKVQNWWKGQALISPAYHLRNSVGNLWNNFLAGVKNPKEYIDAGLVQNGKEFSMIDDLGRTWNSKQINLAARKNGIIGKGQYMADIERGLEQEIKGGNYNPFSQENKLFRGNRAVGGAIEDNARLTNFMHFLKKGLSPSEAAIETKKFLFDYTDLTPFEQNVLKRFMPFYTFTRKNVPLQLEQLMRQPAKFAGLEKVVRAVEEIGMGDSNPANEKYLSDYIKSNTAMRVRYNKDDRSYQYLLLGKWLPAYQAMDFVNQPADNMLQMLTPILKTPIETWMNKSTFWKNSLQEQEEIERYPGEQTNFLGINMPKKTAQVLRNIRILNDLDKLNPGLIFGGEQGQKSLWAKLKMPAKDLPIVGNISASQYKYPKTGVSPSGGERAVGFFLGSNLTSYKPSSARTYYNEDTDRKAQEMQQAIARATATRDFARAKLLQKQLRDFLRERGR